MKNRKIYVNKTKNIIIKLLKVKEKQNKNCDKFIATYEVGMNIYDVTF